MKLIRWLFSNIILIIFVLAITYAYVYWDNLTGEDTPAGKAIAYLSVEYDEVREFLDAYDFGDGEADLVSEVEPEPEVVETASVPQAMPAPRSAPEQPRPQSAPRSQPVPPQAMMQPPAQTSRPPLAAAPTRQQPPPPRPAPASRPQMPPTAMVRQPPAMPQQAPALPPAEPAARQTAPAPAPQPDQAEEPAVDIRELWISAREEYHRGNIQQAIANYQQVIAHSSDNYDAYGELGNVYLSRGMYRDAATAYFQAASILVEQGQIGRAGTLLPMLERLDRAKAQELNQLMAAPRG